MTTDVSPSNGSQTGTAVDHSARLLGLLKAQKADFLQAGTPSVELRRNRIDRLTLLLTENTDLFSEALNADFGNRPHTINLMSEVAGILPDLGVTRRSLAKWVQPDRLRSTTFMGTPTVIEKKPLGVVGVIGPWNFPISLVAQPAASALAAGNRVMIKFSEVTSRTAEVFAEKVAEYFDPTEMTVVTGGVEVGSAFCALPFDHLFFTGSPGVGAIVATAAGKNLVPVTLELGGKNPAVISRHADTATTARRVMAGRLANGGQVCLCPDYAFVPRDQIDIFVEAAIDQARLSATADSGAGLVSIVNEKNFDRVTALIDDARAKGAHVSDTGTGHDRVKRRIAPTILQNVTTAMTIADEEVFGPVLTVLPYDSLDEVVDYIAARPSPLAAYWYGPNGSELDSFLDRTLSGGVSVNDFALHCAMGSAPFGGVGRSGSGAYHGKTGFDTFTHHRAVTISRLPFSLAKMITPPYSPLFKRAVPAYIRFERRAAAKRLARFRQA